MAKCIQNIKTDEVKRISNDRAKELVKKGNWKYISKSDYQRRV